MATPALGLSDLVSAFDEAAATYDSVGVDFFTPIGIELVRRAAIGPGDRVLDVGCGRGAALLPAAVAAGSTGRVVGIDLAPAMVRLTRSAAAAAGLGNVDVTIGDAQDPHYPPSSFDVITASLVLFFRPDPHAALRAYRALLRPGGRLAFSSFVRMDPHLSSALQALARHAPAPGARPGPSELFGTPEVVRSALAKNGYHAVDILEFGVRSLFRDAGHWPQWAWSHGARQLLRTIPETQLPLAAADVAAALDGARSTTGELALTTVARTVTAVRPG